MAHTVHLPNLKPAQMRKIVLTLLIVFQLGLLFIAFVA